MINSTSVVAAATRSRAGARNLLMVSLSRFFAEPVNMRTVLPYMSGDSEVSLRLIDWFVTNFSKKHNVILQHELSDGTTVHFNVYLNYRAQLKAYSKQQFDPFRRRDRIEFAYEEGSPAVETTIGQLNFFRWMLQNRVIDYVARHAAAIERDMMACQRVDAGDAATPDKAAPPQPESTRVHSQLPAPLAYAPDAAAAGVAAPPAAFQSRRCELSQPCTAIRTMTRVSGAHTVAFE
jgi:hypothetical protein